MAALVLALSSANVAPLSVAIAGLVLGAMMTLAWGQLPVVSLPQATLDRLPGISKELDEEYAKEAPDPTRIEQLRLEGGRIQAHFEAAILDLESRVGHVVLLALCDTCVAQRWIDLPSSFLSWLLVADSEDSEQRQCNDRLPAFRAKYRTAA